MKDRLKHLYSLYVIIQITYIVFLKSVCATPQQGWKELVTCKSKNKSSAELPNKTATLRRDLYC